MLVYRDERGLALTGTPLDPKRGLEGLHPGGGSISQHRLEGHELALLR